MMKPLSKTALAVAFAVSTLGLSTAQAKDELTVAYFLEWPTPNQYAQANKVYEKELGMKVNWVSFDAGTAMSAAMASGDVDISFSQGVTPFLVATAGGQNLQIVDVAVSYSDNDNCVVRSSLEIDKSNAKAELPGKKAAVPKGTAAEFGFLSQMKYLGVDPDSMIIVDMAPADGAAAFANPDSGLDMVCGWGGHLRKMKEHGNVILSGAEKEKAVGKVFDVTSVPSTFAEENSELLSKFLAITAKMNKKFTSERDSMMPDIAKKAGMDLDGANAVIDVFAFPTVGEQLSDAWMGGFVQDHLKKSADSLESEGKIKALDDYEGLVDSSYLKAAEGMM